MRIITGIAKGKTILSPEGKTTRPTLDRVKEAIFNILQFDLKETTVLDLFSGSGAIGIEALSRGAKEAVFCDKSNRAINIIKENLEATRLINKSEIINKDYKEALQILKNENKKFNIIFLDPPYKSNYAVEAIKHIIKYKLITEDGTIIVETDDENIIKELEKCKEIEVYDTRKYGIVHVIFLRKG